MTKLPLEANLSFQQKIHVSIFIALGMIGTINLVLFGSTLKSLLLLFFFASGTILGLILFFSKNGLAKDNYGIHKAVFLGQVLLIKQRFQLKDKVACSILKFRKSQKYSFFSAAKPDLAHEFNAFDVYLLNERHTRKLKILSLKKEEKSQMAIDFLTEHSDLKYEIYSPDFS